MRAGPGRATERAGFGALGAFSAARTWQLPVPEEGSFLFVGPHGRTRIDGVHLQYRDPPQRDVYRFQGLPALTRPAAIVDCLGWLSSERATALLDRALQAGWIAVEDLVRRVRSRLGEHGTPRLLELLGGVVGGERSAAERVLTELLRDGGVTGWTANAEIHDGTGLIGVADVAFRRRGWSSRSTGSRTTSRRTVSNATAGGRTGSWRLAGPSCGSPGVT